MNFSKPYSYYRMNKNVLQPEIKTFFTTGNCLS